MWFVYFEKLTGNIIAVHSDYKKFLPSADTTWLVTEQPFDYDLNYLYDRNGRIFSIKLISG